MTVRDAFTKIKISTKAKNLTTETPERQRIQMLDGNRPNETDAPRTEAEQSEEAKPIHKMFFAPNIDAREIARIVWATRDRDLFPDD